MFMAQSRAKMAPMNVPPGSPRQSGGGMGKGGGGQVSTPGVGGKGGGGRPMRGRAFDNNQFGGPQKLWSGPMPVSLPAITGGGDPIPGLQTMFGGPRPAGSLRTQALGAPSQPPALNQYGLPQGMHPSQVASPSTGGGPRPMGPTNNPINPFMAPAVQQGGMNIQGLMAQLQGFGGF